VQALAARRSTPEELGEIRRLLEGRRQGRRHPDFHPDETANAPGRGADETKQEDNDDHD